VASLGRGQARCLGGAGLTWGGLVLAQAKGRDDVLADLVLVLQRVEGRHAGGADGRGLPQGLLLGGSLALAPVYHVYQEEEEEERLEVVSDQNSPDQRI